MVAAASSGRPWADASSHSSGTSSAMRRSVSASAEASIAPAAAASTKTSEVRNRSQAAGSQPLTDTRTSPYACM